MLAGDLILARRIGCARIWLYASTQDRLNKYGTVSVLQVDRSSRRVVATIGGRITVAPTTTLTNGRGGGEVRFVAMNDRRRYHLAGRAGRCRPEITVWHVFNRPRMRALPLWLFGAASVLNGQLTQRWLSLCASSGWVGP